MTAIVHRHHFAHKRREIVRWTTVRDRINGGSGAVTHLCNVIARKWDLNDNARSLHKTTLTVLIYLRVSDQGMFSTVTSSTLEKVMTMLVMKAGQCVSSKSRR